MLRHKRTGATEPGMVVVFIVIASVFAVMLYDMAAGERVPLGTGRVVHKAYSASRDSGGFGTGYDGKGQLTTVYVSQHEDEKYTIIVTANGFTKSITVNASQWGSLREGSEVRVCDRIGKISGASYGWQIE